MEGSITPDQLECLICTELPIKVHETACWGAIICEEWGPKLKTCPNRCLKDGMTLALNVNKFVQRMINHLKVPCPYCKEEFSRSEVLDHKEECPQNKLKPVIINQALHPCVLYKMPKTNSWFWDGLKIIKHGCARTGTAKKVTEQGVSWYCARCDADYCENCIQAYGDTYEESELKSFPKAGVMHLSHPHPLVMYFGANLPEQARKNCLGKYKNGNCSVEGNENARYLICFDWKIVLCEACYLSPPEDFLRTVTTTVHKHLLHLQAIPPTFTWGWDVKSPNCIKKDHFTNKEARISYRCDVCDFDTCIECLKVHSIKSD